MSRSLGLLNTIILVTRQDAQAYGGKEKL